MSGAMTSPMDSNGQMRLPLRRGLSGQEEAFVVSASNAAAHQALLTWPTPLGGTAALCGPAGSGKSHLARVWAERVGALPFDGMEIALADPLELEGRPLMLDSAATVDDETLFHLMNLAQAPGGALLLVSRDPPGAWATDLPDLRSRLNAIRTVGIEAPDDVVFAAMLRRAFASRNITPADVLIDYLVRRIDRSADAAEAVVDRLDALHRPVTRVLARQVLDEEQP